VTAPSPSADLVSPTHEHAPLPPYRWRGLGVLQRRATLIGWCLLGALETARVISNPARMGVAEIPWAYALLANFPWWFAWAILTPAVFALADRMRVDGPRWWLRLGGVAAGGVAIIAIHIPLALTLWYFTNPLPQVRLQGYVVTMRNNASAALLLEILTFSATVGLFYAFDTHRRLHWRELAAVRLAARVAQSEAAASAARLDALRLQVSPHFLFNALNTISALVRGQQLQPAVVALARLGDLLRVSLTSAAAPEVPLATELAHLALYLDIERERFGDRLSVDYEIAEEARSCLVPILCLQPLAENALRHGLAARPGPASLRVRAAARDDRAELRIAVEDDGPGFPVGGTVGVGIGLSNTQARLTQLYGAQGRVEIHSTPGRGATVTLVLPIRR